MSFLSTLVSTGFGGLLALAGSWLTISNANQQDRVRDERFALSLMQSIKAEIHIMEEFYKDTAGTAISNDILNDYLEGKWSNVSGYGTVFKANAQYIGKIKNPKLCEELAKLYAYIDAVFEQLHTHGGLLAQAPGIDQILGVSPTLTKEEKIHNSRNRIHDLHSRIMNGLVTASHSLSEEINKTEKLIRELEIQGWKKPYLVCVKFLRRT